MNTDRRKDGLKTDMNSDRRRNGLKSDMGSYHGCNVLKLGMNTEHRRKGLKSGMNSDHKRNSLKYNYVTSIEVTWIYKKKNLVCRGKQIKYGVKSALVSVEAAVSGMIWGCLTYKGVGNLEAVEENIDCEKFKDCIAKDFPEGDYIFPEANASENASTSTTERENEYSIFSAPDINIIENVCRTIKIKPKKKKLVITSKHHLIVEIMKI
ncbi:hypothetical protein MAR_014921, partial [Mya arenaria]